MPFFVVEPSSAARPAEDGAAKELAKPELIVLGRASHAVSHRKKASNAITNWRGKLARIEGWNDFFRHGVTINAGIVEEAVRART